MSLINDALRRAKQEKKETPPENSSGTPMQPVESRRQPGRSSSPILILLIAIVLLAAGWFFWKGFQAKPESTPAVADAHAPSTISADAILTEKSPPQLPVESAIAVTSSLNPQIVPADLEKPAAVEAAKPIESVTDTNPAATPPHIATLPAQQELKLQGIFYRISNPTALINGKTVSAGEKVSGARVLKIERQEVTVELDGQTKVLTLQ
jgi:hypothetical protein